MRHCSLRIAQQLALPRFCGNHSFRAASNCYQPVSGSFDPPFGVLFSFCSRYCALSVSEKYLGLEVNAPMFALDTRPTLLRAPPFPQPSAYEAITLYGRAFQPTSASLKESNGAHHISERLPARIRIALCGFQSPLLTASQLVSSPAGTKMFQFPACVHATCAACGLAIPGSRAACAYPGLIAACHGLHNYPSQAILWVASNRVHEYAQ